MRSHMLICAPRASLALAVWALGPHEEPAIARAAWSIAVAAVLGAIVSLALDVRTRRAFLLAKAREGQAGGSSPGRSGGVKGEEEKEEGQRMGAGGDVGAAGDKAAHPPGLRARQQMAGGANR
jgi:hypothetical protein